MPYSIVYCDQHFIAVSKPHRMLSVPGLSEPLNLFDELKRSFPNIRTIHRLDMATSGLILFALSYDAQRAISRQFELKIVHKTYVALVHGKVAANIIDISLPLAAHPSLKTRHTVAFNHGKSAQTVMQKLAASDQYSRVLLHPLTGRSHQLRVHCSHIGHPIVGDPFYGDGNEANRLMLHAQSIRLQHPVTCAELTLNSPCPF